MTTKLFCTLALLTLVGCASRSGKPDWQQGTTTLKVTGPNGSPITGFYIRDGKRHPIAGNVPFTLTESGVSEVEIRKGNPAEAVTVETQFESPERQSSYANMVVPPAVPGVRIELRKGFTVEQLTK